VFVHVPIATVDYADVRLIAQFLTYQYIPG